MLFLLRGRFQKRLFFGALRKPRLLQFRVFGLVVIDHGNVRVVLQDGEEGLQIVVVPVDKAVPVGGVVHDGDEFVEDLRVRLDVLPGVLLRNQSAGGADPDGVPDALFALLEQLFGWYELPGLIPQRDHGLDRMLVGIGIQVRVQLVAECGQELMDLMALRLSFPVNAQRHRRVHNGDKRMVRFHFGPDKVRKGALQRLVLIVADRAVRDIPEAPRQRQVPLENQTGQDPLVPLINTLVKIGLPCRFDLRPKRTLLILTMVVRDKLVKCRKIRGFTKCIHEW